MKHLPYKSYHCSFLALFLFACASKKVAQYELPDAMLPHVKVEYEKTCSKGQKLYNAVCANCHSRKVGGKEIIPDFSEEQLKGYALRISNSRHESAMPDTLVTAEELGLITTFLSYKKKSGVGVKK